MELKLEVSADVLSKDVSDIFASLTAEQKGDIAKQLLTEYLSKGNPAEYEILKKELTDEIRNSNSYYKNDSDAKIQERYEFNDKLKSKQPLRMLLVSGIIQEAKRQAAELTRTMVETDPHILKIKEETMLFVKENFSKFVHDAMIAWFCSNLNNVGQGISKALYQSESAEGLAKQLEQRLLSRGI